MAWSGRGRGGRRGDGVETVGRRLVSGGGRRKPGRSWVAAAAVAEVNGSREPLTLDAVPPTLSMQVGSRGDARGRGGSRAAGRRILEAAAVQDDRRLADQPTIHANPAPPTGQQKQRLTTASCL